MKYVIVGAGISGLYTAYKLHKKLGINSKEIIIIEKESKAGGRIDTKYLSDDKENRIELGAGGVSSNHKYTLKLLDELGLNNDLIDGRYLRVYLDSNQKTIDVRETFFYKIVDDLYERLKDNKFKEIAVNYSLLRLIEREYDIDTANKMRDMYGYDGDFMNQNSIDALRMFQTSFAPDVKFYVLKYGMTSIIERLMKYLMSIGVKIQFNTELIDIKKANGSYICILTNNNKITAENIILAIPKEPLLKINYLHSIKNMLSSTKGKPIIRIYGKFPKIDSKYWFDGLVGTITTRTLIRQLWISDEKRGVVQLSYCTDECARTWHYLNKVGMLKKELMLHVRRLFPHLEIPEPEEVYVKYWNPATHMWKPTVDSEKMYKRILKPLTGDNIFIVGEAYSMMQQWSNGALQTVDDMISIISMK